MCACVCVSSRISALGQVAKQEAEVDSTTLKKGIKADPSPTTEEHKLCLQQTKEEESDAKPVAGNPGSEYRIQLKAFMFVY